MSNKEDAPKRIWIAPIAFAARSSNTVIYDEASRESSDIEYIRAEAYDALLRQRDALFEAMSGLSLRWFPDKTLCWCNVWDSAKHDPECAAARAALALVDKKGK